MNIHHLMLKKKEYTYKLKKILEGHDFLYDMIFLISKINDPATLYKIKHVNTNPNSFEYRSFGKENKGESIFFIELSGRDCGMFSYILTLIQALYEADSLGMRPVVSFSNECIYHEEETVNGSDNVFEYYFDRVSDVTRESVFKSENVFFFSYAHLERIFSRISNGEEVTSVGTIYSSINEKAIYEMGKIVKKYLRLNNETQAFIDKSIREKMGALEQKERWLGVHIRGTDYNYYVPGHPSPLAPEDYYPFVDEAIELYGYDKIFLATDDIRFIQAFDERYTNVIYYDDVHRSDGDVNVSFVHNERHLNHYLNGLEVIRDMYTLATCESLIAGVSNVSISSRIFRQALYGQYTHLKIISKGFKKM